MLEFFWRPEVFVFPIGIACLAYGYALKLSWLARAPQAIFTWSLCLIFSLFHFTVTFLYAVNIIGPRGYINWTIPVFFAMYVVIWCLPALEWIKRLKQANTISSAASCDKEGP